MYANTESLIDALFSDRKSCQASEPLNMINLGLTLTRLVISQSNHKNIPRLLRYPVATQIARPGALKGRVRVPKIADLRETKNIVSKPY